MKAINRRTLFSQRNLDHRPFAAVWTSTSRRHATTQGASTSHRPSQVARPILPSADVPGSALAILPLSTVLRSYMVMAISSSPALMAASSSILQRILLARSRLFDVDRNPLLRWLFKNTFYAQFCIGENPTEVEKGLKKLQKVGYDGVILEYAAEVLEDKEDLDSNAAEKTERAITTWRDGLLETIRMTIAGSFVAFKWSGMGNDALHRLVTNQAPSESIKLAMHDICDAAFRKKVILLPAAEPQNAQPAADDWTLSMAREYNNRQPGYALIYNTYQCYLKSVPGTLARHLALAKANGFTLGVKLVRGAYLNSEKRDLIWPTKEETDYCYDSLVEQLLKSSYGGILQPSDQSSVELPPVNVMLATHNLPSVRKARALRDSQLLQPNRLVPLFYAQLQGMADEVSCELVAAGRVPIDSDKVIVDKPRVFKYVTWGSISECLGYLLRRASENQEAMSRTVETRRAMGVELRRRIMHRT